jgi:hypothetical protein
MCLPLNFLRAGLAAGGFTLLALGSAVVWGGYSFTQQVPVETYDYEWIGYVIMAFGLASIVTGIIALVAAALKNPCLLALFVVLCFVIGTVLIVFGSILLYGRTKVDDVLLDEDDCRDSDLFEDADLAVVKASQLICTEVCPCDIDSDLRQTYIEDFNRRTVVGSALEIRECEPCSIDGVLPDEIVESDQCQTITSEEFIEHYFSSDEQDYFDLAEWVENKFDCAGICTGVNFYVFSDINDGPPTESCMDSLRDWAIEVMLTYGALSVSLGVWMYVNVILSYCICCHPKLKQKAPDTAQEEDVELKTATKDKKSSQV